jgi:hypothetical protein
LGATGAIDIPGSAADDNPPATDSAAHVGAEDAGDHSRGADAAAAGPANRERSQAEERRSDAQGSTGVESENGKPGEQDTPGEHGQAGDHGSGSAALGTGTEHALPDVAQGDDPPGAAGGNPHTEGSEPTPPARPDVADESSSNAASRELPEQASIAEPPAQPNG